MSASIVLLVVVDEAPDMVTVAICWLWWYGGVGVGVAFLFLRALGFAGLMYHGIVPGVHVFACRWAAPQKIDLTSGSLSRGSGRGCRNNEVSGLTNSFVRYKKQS